LRDEHTGDSAVLTAVARLDDLEIVVKHTSQPDTDSRFYGKKDFLSLNTVLPNSMA
jgi:hypothetical protein